MRCRYCNDPRIGYSHWRSYERALALVLLRPYRCMKCARRYIGLSKEGRRWFCEGTTRQKWLTVVGLSVAGVCAFAVFTWATFRILDTVSKPQQRSPAAQKR